MYGQPKPSLHGITICLVGCLSCLDPHKILIGWVYCSLLQLLARMAPKLGQSGCCAACTIRDEPYLCFPLCTPYRTIFTTGVQLMDLIRLPNIQTYTICKLLMQPTNHNLSIHNIKQARSIMSLLLLQCKRPFLHRISTFSFSCTGGRLICGCQQSICLSYGKLWLPTKRYILPPFQNANPVIQFSYQKSDTL